MKSTILLFCFSLCLLTGCGAWSPIIQKEEVMPIQTTVQEQTISNLVDNVPTITVTPAHVETRYITNSVAVVNPQWVAAENTAGAIAPFLPPPFGQIFGLGLAGLAGILGLVVRTKNKQMSVAQAVTTAMVHGVEAANDPKTKDAIDSAAKVLGVQKPVDAIVQGLTKGLV